MHSSNICRNPHRTRHLSRKQFFALFTSCTLNPLASAICLSDKHSASTATSTYLASTHSSLLQCRIVPTSNPDTLETISTTLSKNSFSPINKTANKLLSLLKPDNLSAVVLLILGSPSKIGLLFYFLPLWNTHLSTK